MKNSFAVERELFAKESFQLALARTFVAAGQAPDARGKYAVYKTHARNAIAASLVPEGKVEEGAATLATMAGGTDVATCDDDAEPETDDEEDQDDAE